VVGDMEVTALLTFLGILASLLLPPFLDGLESKLRARVEGRLGPPIMQTYVDLIKLFKKDSIVPPIASRLFLVAPTLSIAGLVLAMAIKPYAIENPFGFSGDIILYAYLISASSIVLALGGASSGSPLTAIGAGREFSMLIVRESMLAIIISSLILSSGTSSLSELALKLPFNVSTFLATISLVIYSLLEGYRKPFDIIISDYDLAGGFLAEYSGPLLALSKYAIMLRRFAVSLLVGSVAFEGYIKTMYQPELAMPTFVSLVSLYYVITGFLTHATARLSMSNSLKVSLIMQSIPAASLVLAIMRW
jgi:formate hydrogenlyase subunit 4